MGERLRIRIGDEPGLPITADSCYGWATLDTAGGYEGEGGYTVEWDDGFIDHPSVRWFLDAGLMTSIHEVPENEGVLF